MVPIAVRRNLPDPHTPTAPPKRSTPGAKSDPGIVAAPSLACPRCGQPPGPRRNVRVSDTVDQLVCLECAEDIERYGVGIHSAPCPPPTGHSELIDPARPEYVAPGVDRDYEARIAPWLDERYPELRTVCFVRSPLSLHLDALTDALLAPPALSPKGPEPRRRSAWGEAFFHRQPGLREPGDGSGRAEGHRAARHSVSEQGGVKPLSDIERQRRKRKERKPSTSRLKDILKGLIGVSDESAVGYITRFTGMNRRQRRGQGNPGSTRQPLTHRQRQQRQSQKKRKRQIANHSRTVNQGKAAA